MKKCEESKDFYQELAMIFKDNLTLEDIEEINRNGYHIVADYQEMKEDNEILDGALIDRNRYAIVTNTIITINRCLGSIIQEIENMRDVLKHVK